MAGTTNPKRRRRATTTRGGFRAAMFATICATCDREIRQGDAIVPKKGGGHQHPRCAPGGDDE